MKLNRFGATGLEVSSLGFGTMTLGDRLDESASMEVLDLAFDAGINLFDTANTYNAGRSETIVGQWLRTRGRRDDVVLSSKVRNPVGGDPRTAGLAPTTICRELERSLARLGVAWLDVYFLHQPDYDTPIEITLQCLDGLARAGKFRYLGMSNYASWQVVEAIRIARGNGWIEPTVLQPMYNPIARTAEAELWPAVRRYDLGVCTYNPLAGGLLTGKHPRGGTAQTGSRLDTNTKYRQRYFEPRQRDAAEALERVAAESGRSPVELALAFSLARTEVDCVLLGATSRTQLEQTVACADAPPLAEAEREALDAIWSELRGPIPAYNR